MIRACHLFIRLLPVLALGVMLAACRSAGEATDAGGSVTPRTMGVNLYSLEDHKACLSAGHQSGTPGYQKCRTAWVKARNSQGRPGAAIGFSGFF